MYLARANQENAIYEQQTAAAAKPLNQGVKGLQPKTPGNKPPKTPFKVPLNDENAAFKDGKAGGKGLFSEGKADRSAFVTPAGKKNWRGRIRQINTNDTIGPRNRAPLGNKTTNAKATAFKTPGQPAQEKQSAKQSSPRMRRAKIKIHEADSAPAEDEHEEREIEVMPPREVPLPDYPDDWPHDRTYPQFEGNNLTRGWWSAFAPQKEVNEDDEDELSDIEEKLREVEEREKKARQEQQRKKAPTVSTSRETIFDKPPQTLTSRSAASALSNPKPRSASGAPKVVKGRPPATTATPRPITTIASGNPRHTAARVASNTTLGYSKGRAVSTSAHKPLSEISTKPRPTTGTQTTKPARILSDAPKSLQYLFNLEDLHVGDDVNLGFGKLNFNPDDEEDELEDFQLDTDI